ncbi:MAG: sulfatase [Verrucomicrobia bacterium]|nr:sulfatase [Verrucomicrobiota bacterium]MBT7066099.1 sulfatase [Verrucomicrobiota bacterium]MBT7700309.1 sulfatase [Verrucomicrobiota bacterium]
MMMQAAKEQPNIVYILADDLGWNDLACEGSSFYESPNIDRIAREGMRFTQGYATCQVCSPSRASILTGKVTPRHGITDYIGALTGEAWRHAGRFSKMLPPDYDHALRSDEITFAEVLRRGGYRTFFAGKWHLGDTGADPEDFGFEINKGGWHVGSPHGGYFAPWENPKLAPGPDGESLPMRLGRETAEFIAEHKDAPFLAYLSFYSVHGPIETSRDRWEKYRLKAVAQSAPEHRFIFDRNLPVRQVQDCPIYAGMIEAMDDAVGLVLEALDQHGLADNTIVCFTSDNGGVSSGDSFASSMLPLRGGKGRQWEGGIREPVHVRYPRVVAPGSTCDVPVSGIDFYPTFLEWAGIPIPQEQVVDGRSMVPLLTGKSDPEMEARALFWHYPHYGNQGGDPSAIIRSGSWKLIHYFEDGHDELYDLATDEDEQHDVSAAHGTRGAELRARLDRWLIEVDAKLPLPDPEYDAEKEAAFLHGQEHKLMPRLERQHAEYLDPDWQPNADWWGSQVTRD